MLGVWSKMVGGASSSLRDGAMTGGRSWVGYFVVGARVVSCRYKTRWLGEELVFIGVDMVAVLSGGVFA